MTGNVVFVKKRFFMHTMAHLKKGVCESDSLDASYSMTHFIEEVYLHAHIYSRNNKKRRINDCLTFCMISNTLNFQVRDKNARD
jgi:hypothetical protein